MLANIYGFAQTRDLIDQYRSELINEISLLRREYESLMYGGRIDTIVSLQ